MILNLAGLIVNVFNAIHLKYCASYKYFEVLCTIHQYSQKIKGTSLWHFKFEIVKC